MKIENINVEFVSKRCLALKERWSGRNERMDLYEQYYLLNLWDSEAEDDEVRITPPTGHATVERYRSLFLTRPPIISVSSSEVKGVEEARAQNLEKYLMGVWDVVQVPVTLSKAEWAATCLGEGVIQVAYDDAACEDELPLLIRDVDPRHVFAIPGPRPLQDLEQIYVCKKTRRDIEVELAGDPRSLWADGLAKRPTDKEELEAWLDAKVEVWDYWRLDAEMVEVKDELIQEAPAQMGPLERLVAPFRRVMGKTQSVLPSAKAGAFAEESGTSEAEGGEEEKEPKKVRRQVVTRCVVADGQMLMDPVRLPGYCRLPFVRYAGLETGATQDIDKALSVLFPLTAGTQQNGASGVLAGEAEMLAMRFLLVQMFANGAIITDDDQLKINWSPGAINPIQQGKTWSFLVPPGPHPAVDTQLQVLQSYIEDGSLPAMMRGRYVGDLSGLALSTLTNPVMMQIASRQQIRERAYEEVNRLILSLTEQWAPDDGWYVSGLDRKGSDFELRLPPGEINGYRKNRVKLSASLPKDEAGEVMSMADLVTRKLLSHQTFLERYQEIKRTSSQSPLDELQRILRDMMLFEGPVAQKLAELILADYDPELAELLMAEAALGGPGPGRVAGVPIGPGPGGPEGPMMGMPPGVVAPMPEATGRQGGQDVMQMLEMLGQVAGPGPEEGL